jgi:ABC-type polysaccharide/polyol phosphate transport system ATPase subunit
LESQTAAERTLCRLALPVVIEARGVDKTFRIPERRIDSLKERATHPFTKIEYRELRALRNVSFEVRSGEFFGILGRNGSGKSTLLKILASIYRADAGRVRMAGRVAPFIELGVGFNPDLTARENCVLNGVLMGLTKREARRRLDAIIDFAELRDFVEVELKNYSSGMMVRLAFAVMVQADADVMLIDEVLAVGDAAFARKCMDVFYEKRAAGKTIVLVTHDMGTVELLCHRALLLEEGELRFVGDPREAALRYHRLNFDRSPSDLGRTGLNARVVDGRLLDPLGAAVEVLEEGEPLGFEVTLQALRELDRPYFRFHLVNDSGVVIARFTERLGAELPEDERLLLRASVENSLVPGRYFLDCWVGVFGDDAREQVQALRVLSFAVRGEPPEFGVVSVEAEVEAVLERQPT